MGMIYNDTTEQMRMLAECSVVGRAPSCDVRLRAAEASGEHAAIRWADGRWHVVDLGSRNGTWVDGRRCSGGEPVDLVLGTSIGFGSPRELWILSSDAQPAAFVRSRTRELSIELGLLALPSPEQPTLEIVRDSDGRWFVEDQAGRRPAVDRNVYQAGEESWRIYLPSEVPRTATIRQLVTIEEAELVIRHDQTEEHLTAEIRPPKGPWIALGSRAHHGVLLELARARLADQSNGIAEAEEGWIHREDLSRRLQLDNNHLNILIYRLRRQLVESGVTDGHKVVERRVRSGMLRIGPRTLGVGRID